MVTITNQISYREGGVALHPGTQGGETFEELKAQVDEWRDRDALEVPSDPDLQSDQCTLIPLKVGSSCR